MKTRLVRIVLCLLLLTFSQETVAIRFTDINSLFGISMRWTFSVCEDDYGFIWAASRTGVIRLTDDDHRLYRLPFETANASKVKLAYRSPSLVAYTDNGQIFIYDPLRDEFVLRANLRILMNNSSVTVSKLLVDRQHDVFWIASSVGLLKYAGGSITRVQGMGAESFEAVWLHQSEIFVTDSEGFWRYDTRASVLTQLWSHRDYGGTLQATALRFDPVRRRVWIGTASSGLYRFDLEGHTLERILEESLPLHPIYAITGFTDSSMLVGMDNFGLIEISADGLRVEAIHRESGDDPFSLPGNGIQDLYMDSRNRVWVCTYSGGVSFFNLLSPSIRQLSHQINDPNSLANNNVNGVVEDRRGKLWFATDNGISSYDPGSEKWHNFYADHSADSRSFTSICEDALGRIWASNYSSGVYVIDSDTGRQIAHYPRGGENGPLSLGFFSMVFRDRAGDVWISGERGSLVCHLVGEGRFVKYASEDRVASFFQVSDEIILLGNSRGLSLLDKRTERISGLMSGIFVNDLLMEGRDVWICTAGNGLLHYNYDTGSITGRYTEDDGLPSDYVGSIVSHDGYLWIGTESGICRLDPTSGAVYVPSWLGPLSAMSYNKRARVLLRSGELAWGTNHGMIAFQPETFRNVRADAKLFFQDMTVSGNSIRDIDDIPLTVPVNELQSVDIPYSAKGFNLELLPFHAPDDAKLIWMLEGFDRTWSVAARSRMITYTNLPPGRYTLTMRLMDGEQLDVLAQRRLEINIARPFWMQWWFVVLIVLAAGAVLLLVAKILINRSRRIRYEKKEMFFASATHKIRNSLFLINSPIRELALEESLSDKARSYLELATEQSKRLSTAVSVLIDSQEADIERQQLNLSQVDIVKLVSVRCLLFESLGRGRNIAINFRCETDGFVVTADENRIENVIDNLISGAVNHSYDGGEVWVELRCGHREWTLSVRDFGMDREERIRSLRKPRPVPGGAGAKALDPKMGLMLARDTVKLHRGKITCEGSETDGVAFRIHVPCHPNVIGAGWMLRRRRGSTPPATEESRPADLAPAPVVKTKEVNNQLGEDEMWRMIRTTLRTLENVRKKARENEGDSTKRAITEADDRFLKKAVEAITENMLDPRFGKNDFALAVHVSPSLLYKKLKALTGLSPVEFIKTVKLNYAMELLRSRRYGVTEVSELCGFSSVGYFSTVFRGHFGQPPSTI